MGRRLDALEIELVHALDVLEDAGELAGHPFELILGQLEPCEPRDVEDLIAVDHDADFIFMSGPREPPGGG